MATINRHGHSEEQGEKSARDGRLAPNLSKTGLRDWLGV